MKTEKCFDYTICSQLNIYDNRKYDFIHGHQPDYAMSKVNLNTIEYFQIS